MTARQNMNQAKNATTTAGELQSQEISATYRFKLEASVKLWLTI